MRYVAIFELSDPFDLEEAAELMKQLAKYDFFRELWAHQDTQFSRARVSFNSIIEADSPEHVQQLLRSIMPSIEWLLDDVSLFSEVSFDVSDDLQKPWWASTSKSLLANICQSGSAGFGLGGLGQLGQLADS